MNTPDTTRAAHESREEFEKWALPYLRSQYSFYNEDMIKDMLWKSTGRTLFDAWQAAWNTRSITTLLADKALVEEMARSICIVQGQNPDEPALRWLPDEHRNMEQDFPNWHDFRNEAQAALDVIRRKVG